MTRLRVPAALGVLGTAAVAGGAAVAYALAEARAYTVREVTLPLLPPGHRPLRVLHLSDLHLVPSQRAKQQWLRRLVDWAPDLVVNTGDNLAHRHAVPVALSVLDGLLDVPGVFVLGSNDYFEPTFRNPLRYLLPDDGRRATHAPQLDWAGLKAGFTERGWVDLTNRRDRITVGDTTFALGGLDDPHLTYDDLDAVADPDADADVRLGVVHAPYLRVLDRFAAEGYDAVLAGHTHGGQVCVPFLGALTTNCDLEPARAKGLHRHPAGSRPGEAGSSWLHVSAGIGTSPYARVRVACRPEVTLLHVIPTAPGTGTVGG